MQNSPDFRNDLHQHPDLLLAPQLQNLSYHFFNLIQHHPYSILKEFFPLEKFNQITLQRPGFLPDITFATGFCLFFPETEKLEVKYFLYCIEDTKEQQGIQDKTCK
jgi:hypothetical protein